MSIIYPIYLLSLAIFLAIAASNGTLSDIRTGSLNQYLGRLPWESHSTSPGLLALNLGMNLTLLQAWNPYFLSWNLAAWSLSTLLFFYILFPWLMPRLLNSKRPMTVALITFALYCLPGVLLSVLKVDGALSTGIIHRNPLLRLPEFMIGILLYRILGGSASTHATFRTKILIACLLGLGVYLGFAAWLTATGEPYVWYVLHNGFLLPASVFIVIVASHSKPIFSSAWGKRLGNTALSIFALHGPIGALLRLIFGSVRHATACIPNGQSCPNASFSKQLFLFLFYVATVVVTSLFVQEKVVAPLATALRKRNVSWADPASEAAR
jgi:peptidoglycan/LPS O-acetylase OafA/YrhL